MDFELSEEQVMLRDVSRDALRSHCTPDQVRAWAGDAFAQDAGLWKLGTGLGWTGLAAPEEHGGSAQGLTELCLVAEELGRSAAPGPFATTALVGLALTRAKASAGSGAVPAALAAGTAAATWAAADTTGSTTLATPLDDGGYRLDGRKTLVQDAGRTSWLLVSARTPDGPALFLVSGDLPGLAVRRQRTVDLSRAFHEVVLDGVRVPAGQLLPLGADQRRWIADAAAVLTAADALGAGERLLEMTVEYVTVRRQFGRAIGGFQAVKHKCADMLMTLRGSRAAVSYAAMALDADAPDAARAASAAKAFVPDGVSRVAGEALQLHGGIGFTWEHDLHLYLRRAKADQVLHGDAAFHEDRLCALLVAERATAG
ncbi:acyl-CoA dehydrogenase family protein [Streptomyces sp. NPDC088747]|uniref:acyl-CoA dehydrogenase family protein n=1 Tax=Streptomyces sp. NPDC088747 TaxID=3365886 RepID=UPI003814E4C5